MIIIASRLVIVNTFSDNFLKILAFITDCYYHVLKWGGFVFRLELKKQRENAGLSQYRLSEKLGVSQATVGMWESGKREPNFTTLCKLADFFSVSVDELLGRAAAPTRPAGLPASDVTLLQKFHALDSMAQARILNALDFEYQAIPQESAKSSNFAG